MRPLRLLAILEAYSITGPAKNLLEFARLGRNAGVETTIATFTRESSDNLFIRTARESGIPVELIPERSAYDPAVMRTMRSLVQRLQPDVLQTHAVKSHFLARRAGLPGMAPWVSFHHGYTWPTLKAKLYNQLDRWSLRTADKVLTVSLPFREELVANGVARDRIEIIHNAIPPDWGAAGRQPEAAAACRARLGIHPEKKVILIVGRLSREKDHLTLLEAVNRLRPQAALHLLIVGEGPERPRIEEKIRQLGMAGNVTLTGHAGSAVPYYGIADLAVLSSLSEGSPNALLEAMACGVPVVATSVGGIPEIVKDGESALLVQPANTEQMSEAIGRLLLPASRLPRQLAERSRQLIRERHEPEARAQKLAGIYRAAATNIRAAGLRN